MCDEGCVKYVFRWIKKVLMGFRYSFWQSMVKVFRMQGSDLHSLHKKYEMVWN